jgi:hypothetical protein
MKTSLRAIVLLLLVSLSIIFVYCNEDFENEEGRQVPTKMEVGNNCDGKKILKFSSLAELQQKHFNLYQQFMAGNEEEQILVNYENSLNFYSLRKKDQEMDDGIIPNDPTFDETNYTFDAILETFLNQDGMIVIGDRLYIWDSGCVIHSVPFSCKGYAKLLAFHEAAMAGNTDQMHDIFINSKMQNHNTCDDKNFDFEAISENGGRIEEGGVPREKNKNGCGYDLVVNNKLILCDGFYTYEISSQKQIPVGSTAFDLYYVRPTIGDATDIEINYGLGWMPLPTGTLDATYGYLIPYFEDFQLRVPIGTPSTACEITLVSTIAAQSGGSCMASDNTSINNDCPFSITAIQNNLSSNSSQWTYTIDAPNGCPLPSSKVTWYFGDGSSATGNYSATHTYILPCAMRYLTVTATIDGVVCGTAGKTFSISGIPNGNPCMRANYTFPPKKGDWGGKKVTNRSLIKRNIWGKSVFKSKYKNRINTTKTISYLGNIYEDTGNNSGCQQVNIASIISSDSKSGKKTFRYKKKFFNYYLISAVDPYSVKFVGGTGYNHDLLASGISCSE